MGRLSQVKAAGDVARRPLNILTLGKTGAGKSYSAIQLARQLAENYPINGGGVLVIDTENERIGYAIADVYGQPDPDGVYVLNWKPPYDMIELRQELISAGTKFDVVIIDSLSAFYNREGGIFDRVAQEEAKMKGAGNSFVAWRKPGKEYDDMIAAVTQVPCHVIVTARTKMRREMQVNDKGKKEVVTIGEQAVLRGNETGYEFDLEGETLSHEGKRLFNVTKSRVAMVPEGRVFDGGMSEENAAALVNDFMGYMSSYKEREIAPAAEMPEKEAAQWTEEALVAGIEQAIPDSEQRQAIVADLMGDYAWDDVISTPERMAGFYDAVVEAYQDLQDNDEPEEPDAVEEEAALEPQE